MPEPNQKITKLVHLSQHILEQCRTDRPTVIQWCDLFSSFCAWHFDDAVSGLVNLQTGEPTFTREQASAVQAALDLFHESLGEAFETIACESAQRQLAAIAGTGIRSWPSNSKPEPEPEICEHGNYENEVCKQCLIDWLTEAREKVNKALSIITKY